MLGFGRGQDYWSFRSLYMLGGELYEQSAALQTSFCIQQEASAKDAEGMEDERNQSIEMQWQTLTDENSSDGEAPFMVKQEH